MELFNNTKINKYAIKLIDCKQPPYKSIFTLSLVKLEILKTCIKIYLKTRFIWLSKLSANKSIFYDKKLDISLCLYINDQGFNNVTIKNWYLLLLIGEYLNWLAQVKKFIQKDLFSTYYQMSNLERNEWGQLCALDTRYSYFEY